MANELRDIANAKQKRKRLTETNDSKRNPGGNNAHPGVFILSYIKKGAIIQKIYSWGG